MSAADFFPNRLTMPALRRAVQDCQGCDLYKNATQAVFGDGPVSARLLLIGEQPGDQEDLQGTPFVGAAGRLLDKVLEEAGIPRDQAYVTNAVKHFKWEPRGKRRLHKKPRAREITACKPWLEAEITLIHPEIIVCLGATAAQALLGSTFRLTKQRGQLLLSQWAPWILATYHPSAVLRAPDSVQREQLQADLVADLRVVAEQLRHVPQDKKALA